MKKIFIVGLMLLCYGFLFAQKTPYNVVFDMTSDDTLTHKMALRWISEVVDNNPRCKSGDCVFW